MRGFGDTPHGLNVVAGGGALPIELQDTRSTTLGLSCGSRTRNCCLKDIVTKLVNDGAEDCLTDILFLVRPVWARERIH
jgi:hypothetical protein